MAVPPLSSAGESLGTLLVVVDEQAELSDTQRRLLRSVSMIAFALLRERLVGDLRDPGDAEGVANRSYIRRTHL